MEVSTQNKSGTRDVTVEEMRRYIGSVVGGGGSFLPLSGGTLTGALRLDDIADSTSSVTGSLQTDGGLGVVKKAHFGNRVTIENNIPQLRFIDTNAALDEGDWEFVALAGASFTLRALTEAGGAGDIAFSISRTGTVIATIDFADNNILTTGIGQFGSVGIDTNVPDKSLEIRNASPVIRLRDTGATADATNAFLEFGGTDTGSWVRTGWVGDGSSGSTDISLRADIGNLILADSGGVVLTLSGGNATFTGGVIISSVIGIDINPGSDIDADLITVGVTGAPKLQWDESENAFNFSHDILVAGSPVGSADTIPPIGTILAWHKSFTNTPALSDGWVECNGQTLSDATSVYDGQVIPDLNGDARFLRGSATSGTEQAEDFKSHTHIQDAHTHGLTNTPRIRTSEMAAGGNAGAERGLETTIDSTTAINQNTGGAETRPINMSVVWIMRVT